MVLSLIKLSCSGICTGLPLLCGHTAYALTLNGALATMQVPVPVTVAALHAPGIAYMRAR